MINKCINIITVRGTQSIASDFSYKADDVLCNGILHNDAMGNVEKYHKTFTVYTYMQMPKMELIAITRSMADTKGLVVRVVSDEPWNDYYEIAEFKDGAWNFESVDNIEKESQKINILGFELIRKLLSVCGTIDLSGLAWTIDYYDKQEEERISDKYRRLELTKSGKLCVVTEEKVRLYEEDLNSCHITDILWLINKNTNKPIKQ